MPPELVEFDRELLEQGANGFEVDLIECLLVHDCPEIALSRSPCHDVRRFTWNRLHGTGYMESACEPTRRRGGGAVRDSGSG